MTGMFNEREFFNAVYPRIVMEGLGNASREELSREFLFRRDCDPNKDTYLTQPAIDAFIEHVKNKAIDEYVAEHKEEYYKILQKYLIDHPDGKWSNYFYTTGNIKFPHTYFSFCDLVHVRLHSIAQDEIVVPVKESRKKRILVDDADVDWLYGLEKHKKALSKKLERIGHLRYELMKLLSREELLEIFPKAKKFFEEYDEKQTEKKLAEKGRGPDPDLSAYNFVDDLLD